MTDARTHPPRAFWSRRATALVVTIALTAPFLGSAFASSVTPVFVAGPTNHSCSDFATAYDATWTEFKIDGIAVDGVYAGTDVTVTISNGGEDGFDWSANRTIGAVFVKGGSRGHNLYVYDPPASNDAGLLIPDAPRNAISHVSFCYEPGGGGQQQANPDLVVTKTAFMPFVNASQTMGFTITVTNEGLDPATNVVLHDTLPAIAGTWAVGGADATGCSISGGVLDCAFGPLAPQASFTITLGATATGDDCGVVANFATVTAEGDVDLVPENNADGDSLTVLCADVRVTKTAGTSGDGGAGTAAIGDTVGVGSPVAFEVLVESIGADSATDVALVDVLPPLSGGWTVGGADAAACALQVTTNVLSCAFGEMAPGETRTITLLGGTSVAGWATDCGSVENVAAASAAFDVNATNDASTAAAYVTCSDVGVEKTALAARVDAGTTAGFDLTVTSHGPDPAANVTLTDALPALSGGWALGGPDAADCALNATTSVLDCAFGTLPPGATRTVTVLGGTSAADCGALSNTATASGALDVNASNDASTAGAYVYCSDVGVDKRALDASVASGQNATFVLNVTSHGPDAAENVTLTDALPWTAGGWTLGGPAAADCALTGGNLTCGFGTLEPGEWREVSVTTQTANGECCWLNNTASVTALVDVNATNDQGSAQIAVLCVCPRSPGYWKNHASAWPASSLVLGDETYTKAELTQLLGRPRTGDASGILAFHLIAAKLNVANGAPDPVAATIAQADALLAPYAGKLTYGVKASTSIGTQMTALAAILDAYNNGVYTQPCGTP